jgi:hypothetical protein
LAFEDADRADDLGDDDFVVVDVPAMCFLGDFRKRNGRFGARGWQRWGERANRPGPGDRQLVKGSLFPIIG